MLRPVAPPWEEAPSEGGDGHPGTSPHAPEVPSSGGSWVPPEIHTQLCPPGWQVTGVRKTPGAVWVPEPPVP